MRVDRGFGVGFPSVPEEAGVISVGSFGEFHRDWPLKGIAKGD